MRGINIYRGRINEVAARRWRSLGCVYCLAVSRPVSSMARCGQVRKCDIRERVMAGFGGLHDWVGCEMEGQS